MNQVTAAIVARADTANASTVSPERAVECTGVSGGVGVGGAGPAGLELGVTDRPTAGRAAV